MTTLEFLSRLPTGTKLTRISDSFCLFKMADQWRTYKTNSFSCFDPRDGRIGQLAEYIDYSMPLEQFQQEWRCGSWSPDFPTEAGNYWFYGWTDKEFARKNEREPGMKLVKVTKNAKHVFASTDAQFIYPSEALGLWRTADLPESPEALFEELSLCKPNK